MGKESDRFGVLDRYLSYKMEYFNNRNVLKILEVGLHLASSFCMEQFQPLIHWKMSVCRSSGFISIFESALALHIEGYKLAL